MNLKDREKFKDALRLFATNEKCSEFNLKKLVELKNPIARINAKQEGSAAKRATAEQASKLEATLFLSKDAKVMLTRNVCTQQRLINGSFGVVKAIVYESRDGPPNLPQVIVVQFPSVKCKSCLPHIPNCVAITRETAEWWVAGHRNSRTQFPQKLGRAITVHKCQGLTLSKAVFDLSKASRATGLHFVALSRVCKLEDLLFVPFPFDSLHKHEQKLKNDEYLRLQMLFKATKAGFETKKNLEIETMDAVDSENEEVSSFMLKESHEEIEELCRSVDARDFDQHH